MNGDIDNDEEHDLPAREQIARLEDRIADLSDALERCRKLGIFANALLAGGAVWLVAGFAGYANVAPAMFGAITAILGGFVLKGSNDSTMRQTRAALEQVEARRAELIGSLSLRTVADTADVPVRLH
jgi:hypothetical protein